MFSFPTAEIRSIWGEDSRMRKVVGSRYFTVHQGSNLTEVTNGYAPSIQMARALVLTIRAEINADWVDDRGDAWIPAGNAIASMAAPSKDGAGNRRTKWKGAEPAKFVPINVNGLGSYRSALAGCWSAGPVVIDAAHWIRRQVRSVNVALMIALNPRWAGCHPIQYREGSTGRINAQGHSLQSTPRWVRSAALAGAWDYDISTCHWSILSQMAKTFGVTCRLIDSYIADKNSLRSAVARGAGISLDEAKQCITALLFGARVQHSELEMRLHPGDLVKTIGRAKAGRLASHPDFMALHREVKHVGDAVVEAWPRRQGRLLNDLGIQHRSGSPLAHLLQGAEAAALRSVVMQEQGCILLCMHDGWVAQNRLDVDQLSDRIHRETGYCLRIEESKLEAPAIDQIKRKIVEFAELSEGEQHFRCPFAVTQGEDRPGGGTLTPELVLRESWGEASESIGAKVGAAQEAALWTSHPHPETPVPVRLGAVTDRPGWNLPRGSTVNFIDPKRRTSAER